MRPTNFTYSYCGNDAYGHNECYSDMAWADRNGSALGGDSGAPVFTLAGTGKVTAKGTLSGTGTNHIVFQDFATAQRDFGVNVVTRCPRTDLDLIRGQGWSVLT